MGRPLWCVVVATPAHALLDIPPPDRTDVRHVLLPSTPPIRNMDGEGQRTGNQTGWNAIMIFTGVDNQTVELNILNYQFPDTNDRHWDGNWLNVYLHVNSNVGNWETVDPSMTTWELQELIDWFDTLSRNARTTYNDMSFLEPNLSFELLNDFTADRKIIRVRFDLESRPPFALRDIEYFVDIDADNAELQRIANGLRNELNKYPVRKPAPYTASPKAERSWWQRLFGS